MRLSTSLTILAMYWRCCTYVLRYLTCESNKGRSNRDTTEERGAKFRFKTGQPRKENAPRDSVVGTDPSRGGSEGYSISHRLLLIDLYQAGHSLPATNLRSVQRWLKNGAAPKRKTGNKAVSSMRGGHLLLLAIFKRIYPQASSSQCAVFMMEGFLPTMRSAGGYGRLT